MIDSKTKQRYNLTYRLRQKGFPVDTKNKSILIHLRQFNDIVNDPLAYQLVKEHNFKLAQNKQLELFSE
jgi:hypothetical protein